MPVDYSKWDALELSDDSDIEVHPNVDKRSFIRAKQNQIHQQRFERKREIETLKYERTINDGLLERINALLDALDKHKHEVESDNKNPDELVFQALIESAGDPDKDEPPVPPPGVYMNQKEPQPRYSKMMGSLVDQVKKEVDEAKSAHRYADYVNGVRGHLTKVQNLQQELLKKLAELEKEEKSKITSESIHDGFNASHVSKPKPPASKKTTTTTATTTELLNPAAAAAGASSSSSSTPDAAVSGAEDSTEDSASIKLTPEGKELSRIGLRDYRSLLAFISDHPDIVSEATHDALLVEAFNAQMAGKETHARTCVHHGLLIQYCRQLGPDGVSLFFKRVTQGHKGQQFFEKDVSETYQRIKTRAAELKKEEEEQDAQGGGVEQIQLHAVDPGTEIRINVPQPNSTEEVEQEARKIFESFSPELQRALEHGSLDEVNVVLGKMKVEEAEEVVEKLGQGGMLSLHEGVIDATNEEGQQRLKELEEEERLRKQRELGEPGETEPIETDSKSGSVPVTEKNLVDDID